MPMTPEQLVGILDSFPWAEWRKRLATDIEPIYRDTVIVAGSRVLDTFAYDDPFVTQFATQYIGERIVQLDAFTKQNVSDLLRRVLDEQGGGKSTFDLAQIVTAEVRDHVRGYETWRGHRIARTETGFAYNHGTVFGIKQAGGTHVNVTDGDRDEPCASANGARWTLDEALSNPLAHPNCTRVFSPSPD